MPDSSDSELSESEMSESESRDPENMTVNEFVIAEKGLDICKTPFSYFF